MCEFDSEKVNVGDEVVVRSWNWKGETKFIARVEKKTSSGFVDVNGLRWKKDGKPYGNHKGCLMLLTAEVKKQIEEENKRKLIINNVSGVNWEYISTEAIEKILAIIENDQKQE